MNKEKRMLGFFEKEEFNDDMKEMMLSLVHQDLCEVPWGISLWEMIRLEEILVEDAKLNKEVKK